MGAADFSDISSQGPARAYDALRRIAVHPLLQHSPSFFQLLKSPVLERGLVRRRPAISAVPEPMWYIRIAQISQAHFGAPAGLQDRLIPMGPSRQLRDPI